MSGYNLEEDQDREDRRKHLELVSAVVARMAGASAASKGWSITVAGAAFGIAVVRANWFIFLLGVLALVVFGIVDGLYLHSERKFRDLYDAIIAENSTIKPFSMNPSLLVDRRKRESHCSWSVLGFYGPLAAAGLVLMVVAMCTWTGAEDTPSQSPLTPSQSSTRLTSPPSAPPTSSTAVESRLPATVFTPPAAVPQLPMHPTGAVDGPPSSSASTP